MKIAVLITGQMRDYKVNANNHLKHVIENNDADVFVYACNKNTLHTVGRNIDQKYVKRVFVDENENLDDSDFGTLGYFKRKMNNQMSNIRKGFQMAMSHSEENKFEYDIVVRLRPDNSMLPLPLSLKNLKLQEGVLYSTIYPSGHRDPWFFSFAKPSTFEKYCSFVYMDGCDESRTDNNFDCPELALEKFLAEKQIEIALLNSVCLPFYQYDKTKPITNFPYVNIQEKLIDASGNLVDVKTG